MPKFNFRLQGYLGLKEKLEDQRKQEYGRAMSELERERGKLEDLETRRAETIAAFRDELAAAVSPQRAGNYNNFLSWLKASVKHQTARVQRAEAEAERRRAALTDAMKERKMLETLKDKDYADYVREQNLAEQKAADETVSFRHKGRGREYGG